MVQRTVDAALSSRATKTVVVVGHEAERVRDNLAGRAVTVVVNPEFAAGMSTSVRTGIRAAGACDAAIFLLGDQPFVGSPLVDRLIDLFAETRKSVVRPLVDDRPTNPVLMSAALFPELLAQRGDVGGREIIERHPDEVCLFVVDDSRLVSDIDSLADYEAAMEYS